MSSSQKPPPDLPFERRRVPFEQRVSLEFRGFRTFLTEISANISLGGMFIRTASPRAPGSVFDFEILLDDGFTLIQGQGEVVWIRREAEGEKRPAGMGVRFLRLSAKSRELIRRIVEEHLARGGLPFDPESVPPSRPAAPDPAPAAAPARNLDRPPRPQPYRKRFRPPPPSPWRRRALLAGAAVLIFFFAAAAAYAYLTWTLGSPPPPVGAPDSWRSAPQAAAEGASAATPAAREAPAPTSPPAQAAVAPGPGAAEPGASETVASASRRPVSRLRDISWQPEPGGLAITLQGDGVFEPGRFNRLRLESWPRELVRLTGIARAFPRSQIPVGTPEVEQIRIGYHRRPEGNQLHVVIDLASPEVTLERMEKEDNRLILHLVRP